MSIILNRSAISKLLRNFFEWPKLKKLWMPTSNLTFSWTFFIRVVIIQWHNIAETNKLVKCHFFFCIWKTTRLLAVPKVKVSIREEKFDTAIESLLLIRIPSLCNTFTSTTLSKMIQFWICKDPNDLLHTAQHAEPLVGHIWSHFDWKFQSRRDQTQDLLLARSQNTFLAITLRNQKMAAQIFYML